MTQCDLRGLQAEFATDECCSGVTKLMRMPSVLPSPRLQFRFQLRRQALTKSSCRLSFAVLLNTGLLVRRRRKRLIASVGDGSTVAARFIVVAGLFSGIGNTVGTGNVAAAARCTPRRSPCITSFAICNSKTEQV